MTNKKGIARRASAGSDKRSKALGSATIEAIIGKSIQKPNSKSKPIVKPEWSKYHNILMELRERLLNQMSGLAEESAQEISSYSLHMADSGTDNFDRDFALSLLSSDQDALYEIDEAIKRIEKGTYGVCELTGRQIPRARLEAIPWTRFTVEAQSKLEKEGVLKQKRLGALGSVGGTGVQEVEEEEETEERPVREKEQSTG